MHVYERVCVCVPDKGVYTYRRSFYASRCGFEVVGDFIMRPIA